MAEELGLNTGEGGLSSMTPLYFHPGSGGVAAALGLGRDFLRNWGMALCAPASLGDEMILPNRMLPFDSITGFLLNEVGHWPDPTPRKLGCYSSHGNFSHTIES